MLRWTRVTAPSGPSARDGHAAAAIGNTAFIFGGLSREGQVVPRPRRPHA